MDKINCDVLVVGAGPAGSSAARACAKEGLKTVFVDKRKEIGVPALCAEGIGSYLFSYLPKNIVIPKEQLIWKIDGIRFCCEDKIIDRTGRYWKGYSVDRTKFDKWVAGLAVQKGAQLFRDTELIDFVQDKNKEVKKAIMKNQGNILEVHPKIVIGADGVWSKVSKLMGLYKEEKGAIASIYSLEMENLNLEKPHLEQIFFSDLFDGYGYIFPKSKTRANIGVGCFTTEEKTKQYFNEFLELPIIKKQVKDGQIIIEKSKKAVFGDITKTKIFNNVILSGDAANHNLKPFVEGILPSIISGRLAGKYAKKRIEGEKVTNEQYQRKYEKMMHPHLHYSKDVEKKIIKWNNENNENRHLLFLGISSGLFDVEKLDKYEKMNYTKLKSQFNFQKIKYFFRLIENVKKSL